MFLKPANSGTENGIKNIFKMSPEIMSNVHGKLENCKRPQNNTVIEWLPNLKKKKKTIFFYSFSLKKCFSQLPRVGPPAPPPLADYPAKNASFFIRP